MFEEVENDTPVVETETNDDGFDDVSVNDIEDDGFSDIEIDEPNTEETETESDTNALEEVESEEKEIDFKPFLEYLSKNTKYNKENVNVENIEEVISNFQKGLNYEKLQNKIDSLENGKALTYINEKANQLGLSVDEYMEQVENYEKEQQKQRDAERLQEMIDNGVPEDVAREVIATSELRKQLQEEKNQIERERKEQEAKQNKDKEYDDFIREFPDVKAEDIPKEVFETANNKNQTLTQAYKEHLYNAMKKELEQYRQNDKNSKRSVGSTQGYGGKENHGPRDLFLEGFDS